MDPCRRLVEGIAAGRVEATTAVDVLQEFTHVYARRRSRREAARIARHYAELLAPVFSFERGHLEAALRLFERQPALGAFDALLAAAAIAQEADALVSADEAFRTVPGLRLVEPATSAFEELLAGA